MSSVVGFRGTTIERFAAKIADPDENGCVRWIGSVSRSGYGKLYVDKRQVLAHRFAYEQAKGPIPNGLTLDHLCRVRSCVNPNHLEAVTNRENILRGTSPSAIHAKQTHCKRGHEFDERNTLIDTKGRRNCRRCHRLRQAAYAMREAI